MFYKGVFNSVIVYLMCSSFIGFSQEIPIGDWRDHLPYIDAVSVSYGNNVVYCATNSAVFTYDKTEFSIERLNLVNGLSDIGVSKIMFNGYNNKVIIAYTNGNIDIINTDKSITNLPFIKNSNVVGSKTINHIFLQGKLAYLSTGFGIVVLDTDKLEIIETYLFGPLGGYMITNAVTMDNNYIYAATDQGVYFADKNILNLIDYNVWSKIPDLGTLDYRNIVYFSGRIFTSSSLPNWDGDTVFYNDAGIWQKFILNGIKVVNMSVTNDNQLIIISPNTISGYDLNLNPSLYIGSYNTSISANPRELIIDNESKKWIADNKLGLVKQEYSGYEFTAPNGPSSANVFKMDFVDDALWVVSGSYDGGTYAPNNNYTNLINYRAIDTWGIAPEELYNRKNNAAHDAVSVAINPTNKNQVFVGTWDDGLFEFNNGVVTNLYYAQNSVLDSTFFGSTKVGALAFDTDNNLWISNSFTNNQLAVKTPENNWYSFSFPGKLNATNVFTNMLIDKNNYKWIVEPRKNSILVFDDNGTLDNSNDDQSILLTPDNNKIPGTKLQCIAIDLSDKIWMGTNEGIAVFYNPAAVFDETIEAEQIYIQQDGQTQLLLETETVTAIAIDGANRKWIGTQNSGVFLMSEDGTEEIEHFTTENSPLFSNAIYSIVINQKTGEIYFGTEKGLISYKGTATEADDDFNNVFVYPNPVKPDFTGTIAIRGLVKDTDVRITDISGNIVYQTKSLGGQAIWDGKDFHGNKVQTGVYMVFNGSPEGDKKAAAKILFIH